MNYRHIYHSGNFTEVIKHVALVLILNYLRKKPAAFCYIDSHAGEGIYDLTAPQAVKTGEAKAGVQRIIHNSNEKLQPYLQLLQPFMGNDQLQKYPGSPWLAYQLLRSQDEMILNEMHPEVSALLKANLAGRPNIAIHQRNAYEFLPAILPPKIKRGLVLIDPPFEQASEDEEIEEVLKKCLQKWAHGIYMIWFPVTSRHSWNLKKMASENGITDYLIAAMTITGKHQPGLQGCQLLLINPPWTFKEEFSTVLKDLWKIFSDRNQGGWSITNS